MRFAPLAIRKAPPRWVYWIAAPLAPVAAVVGALLCVAISHVLMKNAPDRDKPPS